MTTVGSAPAGVEPARLAAIHHATLSWYADHARPLPWRSPDATPWQVLVCEVMSQQTPVVRVEPAWRSWVTRWPTPAALADSRPDEVVRAWDRLGYPRRALRLREAAQVIMQRHDGQVPRQVSDLVALPGVGPYTAAAVACFAFGVRVSVLDTNVRRVLRRALRGVDAPAGSVVTADRELADAALPAEDELAATWNVAAMELGALVCTARNPQCHRCPAAGQCAWLAAGRPAYLGPVRRPQPWHGTDRQARGALLALLRATTGAVREPALRDAWPDRDQRDRCLESLLADGLVERAPGGGFRLPA